MAMLALRLVSFSFVIQRIFGLDIELWAQDESTVRVDPVSDLGLSLDNVKTGILRNDITPFDLSIPTAYSMNDVNMYYDEATDLNGTFILTSILQNNSNGGSPFGMAYIRNDSLFLDDRVFNTSYLSDQNKQFFESKQLANIKRYPSNNTHVVNCFDARYLQQTLLVACKVFRHTGANINSGDNSKALIIKIDTFNESYVVTFMESKPYWSHNPSFGLITWPKFATSNGSEELFLSIVDDHYNKSADNSNNTIIMFVAGKDFSSNITMSSTMLAFTWEHNIEDGIAATASYCSSFTLSNTIGGGIIRNMLVAFFTRSTTPFEIICYNKDETEFNEDKIRTLFSKNDSTSIKMTCRSVKNDNVTKVIMDKVYTPSTQTEMDVYFRISLSIQSSAFKFETMFIKASSISSSNSVTYLNYKEHKLKIIDENTKKVDWYPNFKLVIVLPNKLFYVCWLAEATIANNNTKNPFTNCQVIDLFTVDDSKYQANNSSSLNQVINMHSRIYGPFGSLNFRLASTGDLSLLFGYKYYQYQEAANNKVLSIYDMKNLKYSIPVDVSSGFKNNSNWISADFKIIDPSFTTAFELSYPSQIKVINPSNINTTLPVYVFFMHNTSMLIETFSNSLLATEPQFTCNHASSPEIESCNMIPVFRYQISYNQSHPAPRVIKTTLFQDRYIEFEEISYSSDPAASKLYHVRIGYYDLTTGMDFSVSPAERYYRMAGQFLMSNKAFIGSSLFSYANFTRGEQDGYGIYLYFSDTNSNKHGVIRFDSILGTFRSGVYNTPIKVSESFSKFYIATFSTIRNGTTVNTKITIWYGDKLIGEDNEIDISAGLKDVNIDLAKGYVVDSIDDLYVEYDKLLKSVKINIIARSDSAVAFNRLLFYSYSFIIPSTSSQNATAELRYQKVLDQSFVNDVYQNPKCIYKERIFFIKYTDVTATTVNITIIILNTNTGSYFKYEYENTEDKANKAQLFCAKDFADIYFPKNKDSFLFRLDQELQSFSRIKSVTRNLSLQRKRTFSSKIVQALITDNSFWIEYKQDSKFYLNLTLKDFDSKYKNKTTSLGSNLSDFSMTVESQKNSSFSANATIRPFPIFSSRGTTNIAPIYVGQETVPSQQKILFKKGQTEVYNVEETYQFPFDIFNLEIDKPDYMNSIKINKRIRHLTNFSILSDYNSDDVKTCDFAKYGATTVKIIDNVMLRVSSRDEGFCIELSIIQTSKIGKGDSFQSEKPAILIQATGTISSCQITRDRTISTTEQLQAMKAANTTIDYGITCVYTEGTSQSLWILRVPISNSVNGVIKLSENLLRVPINKKFTNFKIAQVGSSFYYTLIDKRSNMIYTSPRLVSKAAGFDLNLKSYSGNFVEFSYFKPVSQNEAKESGLTMDIAEIKANQNEIFIIKPFSINQNGEMTENPMRNFYVSLDELSLMSCAYQTDLDLPKPNMHCAYLYKGSGNSMFYRVNLSNPSNSEKVVPQFGDLELKDIKTIYIYGEFYYVTLNYSPGSGKRFLIVMKHENRKASYGTKGGTLRSDFEDKLIIIYDSWDLQDTIIDVEDNNLSVFFIDNQIFMSISSGKNLSILSLANMSIQLESNLTFSQLEETKVLVKDQLGKQVNSFKLSALFREKLPMTYKWLIILASTLGLAALIIGVYLIFKKRNVKLENEINANLDLDQETDIKKSKKTKKENEMNELEL